MSSAEFNTYLQLVKIAKNHAPTWRMGQAFFNTLASLHPAIAETYRSTAVDPFYQDSRIAAFLSDLYNEHVAHSL